MYRIASRKPWAGQNSNFEELAEENNSHFCEKRIGT